MKIEDIKNYIVDVKDYPKKDIVFKDITNILKDKDCYSFVINTMIERIKEKYADITHIVAPESRGFWFGAPVATSGGYGFIPVRKPNKLPRETINVSFNLEYGSETLCIHKDALKKGDKVLVIDDVLATGGTLLAIEQLIEQSGATLYGYMVLAEIPFLNGRAVTKKEITSLIEV